MKRALVLGFVLLGLAVLFVGSVESKVSKAELAGGIQKVYFVRGQDYVRADGQQAFTIEHEVSYIFDPRDAKELKRHKAAAELALDVISEPEPLRLSAESEAKYHPDCPQYQIEDDAIVSTTGPILEPAPEDCTFGGPGPCANIKTKDMYDCWGPPTNCFRSKKR